MQSLGASMAFLAGLSGVAGLAGAADEAVVTPEVGPTPAIFDLSHEYYKDAGQVLQHMK